MAIPVTVVEARGQPGQAPRTGRPRCRWSRRRPGPRRRSRPGRPARNRSWPARPRRRRSSRPAAGSSARRRRWWRRTGSGRWRWRRTHRSGGRPAAGCSAVGPPLTCLIVTTTPGGGTRWLAGRLMSLGSIRLEPGAKVPRDGRELRPAVASGDVVDGPPLADLGLGQARRAQVVLAVADGVDDRDRPVDRPDLAAAEADGRRVERPRADGRDAAGRRAGGHADRSAAGEVR